VVDVAKLEEREKQQLQKMQGIYHTLNRKEKPK